MPFLLARTGKRESVVDAVLLVPVGSSVAGFFDCPNILSNALRFSSVRRARFKDLSALAW